MSDFLLELGKNPQARRFIKAVGLPVPLPPDLRRARGPWEPHPLADQVVGVGGVVAGPTASLVAKALAPALVGAGAVPEVDGAAFADVFAGPAEAFGRPLRRLGAATNERLAGALFDATDLADPAGLRALYDFFHPLLPRLAPTGRVVVLGRPSSAADSAAQAAARAALDGFVRSLAKETGKRGITAQLLQVAPGAEARLGPVLRFVLSRRSAFVTGQSWLIDDRAQGGGTDRAVLPLEGKVAVVTGAARGIGESTARRLAEEGAKVVLVDRPGDEGPLFALARTLGGRALALDIAAPETPAALAADLRTHHQGVDIVVHNAGITRDKTLARMSAESWDQVLAVNLAAIVRLEEALSGSVLRVGGRVICLSSVAGIAGNVGQTNYAASKAGVIGFVRHHAGALAARGITVNAVAPGFIETRLTAAIPFMVREAGRRLSALGQGGLPGDVAEVITFLSSPGAQGLTGQVVRVCGGSFLGA